MSVCFLKVYASLSKFKFYDVASASICSKFSNQIEARVYENDYRLFCKLADLIVVMGELVISHPKNLETIPKNRHCL